MQNVNEATIEAYTSLSVKKNLTISFPGDSSISDITNENILEESMKLTQSICEENTLAPGGCNAAQFEITVFNVDTNFKNKEILVKLDCKDSDYKGAWTKGNLYALNDIVKYKGKYYRCIQDMATGEDEITWISPTFFGIFTFYVDTSGYDNIKIEFGQKHQDVYLRYGASEEGMTMTSMPLAYSTSLNIKIKFNRYVFMLYGSGTGGDLTDAFNDMKMSLIKIADKNKAPDESECFEEEYGYIDTSGVEDIYLFHGIIKSAIKQKDHSVIDILAYDYMDALNSVAVKDWFNSNFAFNYPPASLIQVWEKGKNYNKGEYVKVLSRIEYDKDEGIIHHYSYFLCLRDITDSQSKIKDPLQCFAHEDEFNNWVAIYYGQGTTLRDLWQEIDATEFEDTHTIKEIRHKLFQDIKTYHSIDLVQTVYGSGSLRLDNVELHPAELTTEIGARKLLEYICEMDVRFGRIIPGESKDFFDYKSPIKPAADSNYKGKWFKNIQYGYGNVVCVNNADTGYVNTYFKCIKASGQLSPTEEGGEEYWSSDILYHPSGYINLTHLYEQDGAEYSEELFNNNGIKIVDDNGEVLKGHSDSIYLPIIYNPMYSGFNNLSQEWDDIVENIGNLDGLLQYTPYSLSVKGLPFLEAGDFICFDVIEKQWLDEEGNLQQKITTVYSMILARTLSGIQALMDELEAKLE